MKYKYVFIYRYLYKGNVCVGCSVRTRSDLTHRNITFFILQKSAIFRKSLLIRAISEISSFHFMTYSRAEYGILLKRVFLKIVLWDRVRDTLDFLSSQNYFYDFRVKFSTCQYLNLLRVHEIYPPYV